MLKFLCYDTSLWTILRSRPRPRFDREPVVAFDRARSHDRAQTLFRVGAGSPRYPHEHPLLPFARVGRCRSGGAQTPAATGEFDCLRTDALRVRTRRTDEALGDVGREIAGQTVCG